MIRCPRMIDESMQASGSALERLSALSVVGISAITAIIIKTLRSKFNLIFKRFASYVSPSKNWMFHLSYTFQEREMESALGFSIVSC